MKLLTDILSSPALEADFWNAIDKRIDGCWCHSGFLQPNGYALWRGHYGHRWSFTLSRKRPPAKGMMVCHHCDTRSCVHPFHIFEGTAAMNSQDMILKDRSPRGIRGAKARLSEAEVLDIRAACARGVAHNELAALYGVNRQSIYKIDRRINWRHL